MSGREPKPIREIPFSQIERQFGLLYLNGSPAVGRESTPTGYRYYIRCETWSSYTYFHLAEDGTVLAAPRGYAKYYRPGRITGMDAAVAKYATGGES